ncbi:MAG TPA: ion transporter, partial [Herpetosiphonaceae bacterium]
VQHERWSLLEQINSLTDKPMIALSFVWLGLLILDFTQGLSPLLQTVSNGIWAVFVLDFAIEITIAPHKLRYLKRNWLTVISLLLPALRILRIVQVVRLLRVARAARSLRLLRVLTSLNRGLRAVGKSMGRRGISYVIALTTIVTFAGAAGMYAFESPASVCEEQADSTEQAGAFSACLDQAIEAGSRLESYGEAVWWTAMTMTTMGSDYFPQTAEGRILGWLLALYAFAIFGYITATIASLFVGQDAVAAQGGATGDSMADVAALREEIAGLRAEVAGLVAHLQPSPAPQTDGDRSRHSS